MSSSRRVNLRKSKNTSKDANQSISNFVQRRSTKDECVEIIEEDDVQDLSDQVMSWVVDRRKSREHWTPVVLGSLFYS